MSSDDIGGQWKVPQPEPPLQPHGIANVEKQPHDRQMPCKGRNLPIAPAQIR